MSIEHNDVPDLNDGELSDGTGELDRLDTDLDGVEDADDLAAMADQNRPYGEVTAQDMSDQDLIADGADLATSLDDDERIERRADGVLPLDEEIVVADQGRDSETIEDRIQQEVPDPNSSIVPPDAGRRA